MTCNEITAYTEACDLWSLGVVVYVMLSGKPPFWGTRAKHLETARRENYPLDIAPWPSLSANAKDFVKRLLKADPSKRMSIDDCCNHPWLTANLYPEDPESQRLVIQNMRQFQNAGLFQSMCVTAVARQLDFSKLQGIHSVFRTMDKNGDGYLCINEVREGFKQIHGENSTEYKELEDTFKCLDLDGSGIIDYTEFCAAGMGQHTALQDESIWAAFKTFDIDNTNTISPAELEKVLASADVKNAFTPEVCASVASKMLSKYDKDGDGAINYDEWVGVMRQVWAENKPASSGDGESADAQALETSSSWAYDLLLKVSKLAPAQ
jgi:calcium-dependent protein kinase